MRSRSRPKNPSSSLRQTNPTPHDLHRPAIAVRQIKQKLLQQAANVTIADKGYDTDHLCDRIAETGGARQNATGPSNAPTTPTSTRSATSATRFFNKLKQFRRVATRYDKLLANFMGFVKLAAIAIWLR
jgi:transposase